MNKWRVGCLALTLLSVGVGLAQTRSFQKNFTLFKEVSSGVDFFARSKSDFAAFEKPVREAHQKLESLLGRKLARGAIVVCSTMEQKDSVQEKSVLKLGYSWVLIQLTPEAEAQQRIAEIKARLGNMLPPGVLERMQSRSPEQKAASDARLVGPMMQKMCFALTQATLQPEKEYKSSRLDDLSRSPLADWLDLGLAWYASGAGLNVRLLQERLDEAFPMEDVLSMPRPFVAPQGDGGPAGGMMVIRSGNGGSGQGGAAVGMPSGIPVQTGGSPGGAMPQMASGGRRGDGEGGGRRGDSAGLGFSLPKDVQDRMVFDSQSASFFSYVIEKLGVEKAKSVVQWSLEGKLTSEILSRQDFLGPDVDKTENDWREWVKARKPEEPGFNRMMVAPGKMPVPPQP